MNKTVMVPHDGVVLKEGKNGYKKIRIFSERVSDSTVLLSRSEGGSLVCDSGSVVNETEFAGSAKDDSTAVFGSVLGAVTLSGDDLVNKSSISQTVIGHDCVITSSFVKRAVTGSMTTIVDSRIVGSNLGDRTTVVDSDITNVVSFPGAVYRRTILDGNEVKTVIGTGNVGESVKMSGDKVMVVSVSWVLYVMRDKDGIVHPVVALSKFVDGQHIVSGKFIVDDQDVVDETVEEFIGGIRESLYWNSLAKAVSKAVKSAMEKFHSLGDIFEKFFEKG